MKKTEKRLIAGIDRLKRSFGDSSQIEKFEKTSQEFEKLVKNGVTKKRGNNLLSPADPSFTRHFTRKTHSKTTTNSVFLSPDPVK